MPFSVKQHTSEIELKLRVQSTDLPQIRAELTKRAGGARAHQSILTSLYFDTPQLSLRQAGAALRVRRVGRHWVQTLKGGGAVQGGMHVRAEQEWPVTHPAPDLSKLDPAVLGLDWPDIGPRLVPVFNTVFQRRVWLIAYQGSEIEAALDRGWVHADEHKEAILELELELKAGQPAALYALGLSLASSVALAPDPVSKAERGYRLFQESALAPAKAVSPALQKKRTVEQAFVAIAWNCLDQLQRNQRGVAEKTDPEFIHQARVALRRLRSALALFATAVPRASWNAWSEELRWLANELGVARDWDVLEDGLLASLLAHLQGHAPLEYLPRRVKAERRKAHRKTQAAVVSQRYGLLTLSIARWLEAKEWRTQTNAKQLARLDRAIQPWAEKMLTRLHQQLHRRARRLTRLSDKKRHRLRVTAKKLRYAAEFFVTLYSSKASRRYLGALAALQEALGTLNDNATALQRATQFCKTARDRRCRVEVDMLSTWTASRSKQQLRQLAKVWKDYRRQSPFWG